MVKPDGGLDTSLNGAVGSTLLDTCSSTVRICAQKAAAEHRRLTSLMQLGLADRSSCPAQALSRGLALLDQPVGRVALLVTEDGARLADLGWISRDSDSDDGYGGNEVGELHLDGVGNVVIV